jgi:hypothetical protein
MNEKGNISPQSCDHFCLKAPNTVLLYAHLNPFSLVQCHKSTSNTRATQNIAVASFFPYYDTHPIHDGFYEMRHVERFIFFISLSPLSAEGGVLCVQRAQTPPLSYGSNARSRSFIMCAILPAVRLTFHFISHTVCFDCPFPAPLCTSCACPFNCNIWRSTVRKGRNTLCANQWE